MYLYTMNFLQKYTPFPAVSLAKVLHSIIDAIFQGLGGLLYRYQTLVEFCHLHAGTAWAAGAAFFGGLGWGPLAV